MCSSRSLPKHLELEAGDVGHKPGHRTVRAFADVIVLHLVHRLHVPRVTPQQVQNEWKWTQKLHHGTGIQYQGSLRGA